MSRPGHTLGRAFYCAFVGICDFCHGRNSRIQLGFAATVTAAGIGLRLARWEWIVIVSAIGFVLAMEAMNTAIERTVDLASPGEHELARQAKDLAAGAVLIASIATVIIGGLIFYPHLIALGRPWGLP